MSQAVDTRLAAAQQALADATANAEQVNQQYQQAQAAVQAAAKDVDTWTQVASEVQAEQATPVETYPATDQNGDMVTAETPPQETPPQ